MSSHLSIILICAFILLFAVLFIRYIWQDPEKRAYFTRRRKSTTRMNPPTPIDIIRYRYHHGSNLGSVFILERWLTPSMFASCDAAGTSELAAVESSVKQIGLENTRVVFEKHWTEYISDSDLDWLRDAKCTTVRLPIGYFTLGPGYCQTTPFKAVAPVYQNAWSAVKQLIQRCNQRGIGVLIDLHGLPGGANDQDHSGTNSGKAELLGNQINLALATRCVCFVVEQAKSLEGVVGVQIVNEAQTNAKGIYDWYDHVLAEVCHIDPTMPIYVSDAWNLTKTLTWLQAKNSIHVSPSNPVVIDTHIYWAVSDADKQKTPRQIIYEVHSKLSELDGKDGTVCDRGAAQVVVGEYSCVLDNSSWEKAHGTPKDQLVKQFGEAQSQRYQHRSGACMFWTYRMDWMPGGEWGFRQMTEQCSICIPLSLSLSAAEAKNRASQAQNQRAQRRSKTVSAHCNYWDTTYPGTYEHWRFEQGWDTGFSDAAAFFEMRGQQGRDGADKIGMLDLWCLKRLKESGQTGDFIWEFEQGLRQGVRDFGDCVGV